MLASALTSLFLFISFTALFDVDLALEIKILFSINIIQRYLYLLNLFALGAFARSRPTKDKNNIVLIFGIGHDCCLSSSAASNFDFQRRGSSVLSKGWQEQGQSLKFVNQPEWSKEHSILIKLSLPI